MSTSRNFSRLAVYLSLLLVAGCATTYAQSTPPPQKSQDDVVRVYTELVQTDVMVFDKNGKFVNGLTKDNFELRIDGKPRAIEGFEQIEAGSDEESQLAAARGATTINLGRPVPLDRGRIVFFFVDDLPQPASAQIENTLPANAVPWRLRFAASGARTVNVAPS
jgi:hypothetical protein